MYRITIVAILFLAVSVLTKTELNAQQVNVFNNNLINPYSINPSKAGYDGSSIFMQQRNQWIGVDGAPVSSRLTAEWRLGKSKSAIGFHLTHNKTNILSNTSGLMTYAHHFKLSENQNLSFGLSFGINNNSILYDRVHIFEEEDQIIFNYNQTGSSFDASFGATYQLRKFEIQFSALQLLANKSLFVNTFEQKEYTYNYIRHYFASASYKFEINKNINITPILQARNVQGFNIQPEAAIKLGYKELIWAALKYNYKRSTDLTIGIAVSDKFVIGYSAEIATNSFASHNAGTHEILLGIKLGKSFLSDINKKEIEKLKEDSRGHKERIEYLQRENERLRLEQKEQKKIIEEMYKNGATFEEIKKELERLKENKSIED